MNFNKELIIITGCSGRIGTAAIKRFADQFQVVGFDIYPPPVQHPNVDWIKVDLSSTDSVQEGMTQVKRKYGDKIASVLHLAAYYNFTGEPSDKYETITVQGTHRMLQAIKGCKVDQFIFSSTMLVHAPCEPWEKINEDSPILGDWDYPKSKVETETLMKNEHGNIPIVMLRIGGVYDDHCHSIPISNQIQRIYERQFASFVFPGNLTHGASFVHMDDLIDCFWLCVQKRATLPKETTLIISEPTTMSYDQLQRSISQLLFGREIKTLRIPKWFAKVGAWAQNHTPFMPKTFIKPWMIDVADANYTVDISRAKAVLGWEPKNFVGNVLPKMIQDMLKDPLAWYKEQKLDCPAWLKKKLEK